MFSFENSCRKTITFWLFFSMLTDYYAYGLERKLILYCFMQMYALHKHAQIHPHSNIFAITHTDLCIRNKQN